MVADESGLFDIHINDTGKSYILKFARFARFGFIFLFIYFLVELIVFVKSLLNRIFDTDSITSMIAYEKVYYAFWGASLIVSFLGAYYYFKFGHKIKKGILEKNEIMFNSSFKLLYTAIVLFVSGMMMGFLQALPSLLPFWF